MRNPRMKYVLSVLAIVVGFAGAAPAVAGADQSVTPVFASAETEVPLVAEAAAYNYCGPAVKNVKGLIAYYQTPAGKPMAAALERAVRADARYTGIKADQSFLSWLGTTKARIAPQRGPGYKINKNTRSPGNNIVEK